MNLKASLLDVYFKLENIYYAGVDAVNSKLPVYKYLVNPIEERGLPSFPVISALFLLLLGGMFFFLFAGPSGLKVTVLESKGQAVEGAYVSLMDAGGFEVLNGFTDSNGVVFFKGLKNAKTIVVSAEGFADSKKQIQPGELIIKLRTQKEQNELAAKENSQNTSLAPVAASKNFTDVLQFLATPEGQVQLVTPIVLSSILVNVTDQNGDLVLGSTVNVFDAHSNALIKSATAATGKALIDGILVNQEVYVTATKEGYQVANRSQLFIVTEQREVNIQLTKLVVNGANANAHNTNFSVTSQANPIAGALITIYTLDGTQVANATTARDGNALIALLNKQYYAVIQANGYLTFVTDDFQSGAQIKAELLDSNLGVALTANAIDFNLQPIQATFGLFNERGRFIQSLNENKTNANFFKLYPNVTVTVKASSGTQIGTNTVKLENVSNQVTIQLDTHYATLIVNAVDLFSLNEILANATAYLEGAQFVTCQGVNCTLKVRALPGQVVNVSHADYFSQLLPLETPLADQNSTVYVKMLSTASVQDSKMILNSIRDAATLEEVREIKSGRLYFAAFSAAFVNSDSNKIYFSPSEPLDSKIQILNFTPLPTSANVAVEGYKSSCNPIPFNEQSDYTTDEGYAKTFSRIAMTTFGSTAQGAPSNYAFFFAVNPRNAPKNTTLTWHSLITRGADTIRNPYDAQRGTLNESDSPECDSTADTQVVNITSPNSEHTDYGDLSISLSQDKAIAADLQNPLDQRNQCGGDFSFQDFAQFDCNGFAIDSGSPNEFYLNFTYSNLNVPINSPMTLTVTASNEYFELQKYTYKFDELRTFTPQGQLPEIKVETIAQDRGNRQTIKGVLELKAIKQTDFTKLKVSLQTENGVIEKEVYVSITGFNLNPSQNNPQSAVLFKDYDCGFTNSLNFSYDPSLVPLRGTGWVGCSKLPLVVDPIFPADAIKIYIQNNTCISSGNPVLPKITLDVDSNKAKCYYAENTYALENTEFENYSSITLKYNAARAGCEEINGNVINPTNATLRLSCEGISTNGQPIDTTNLTINVTVNQKVSNFFDSNLKLQPIITDYKIVGPSENNRIEYWSTTKPQGQYTQNCPSGTTTRYALVTKTKTPSGINVQVLRKIYQLLNDQDLLTYTTTPYPPGADIIIDANGVDMKTALKNAYNAASAKEKQTDPATELTITVVDKLSQIPSNNLIKKFADVDSYIIDDLADGKTQNYFEKNAGGYTTYTLDELKNASPKVYQICESQTNQALDLNKYPNAKLLFTYGPRGLINTPLNPQIWLGVNNLQFQRELNLKLPDETAPTNSKLESLTSSNAVALPTALKYTAGETFQLYDKENKIDLTNSIKQYSDLSEYTPTLHREQTKYFDRLQEADAVLNATALRRSANVSYWCDEHDECKPTLSAWLKIKEEQVQATTSCKVCNAQNCDATCNKETNTNAAGDPCFNYCAAPICEEANVCTNGIKQITIPGRTTLEWQNTTPLHEVQKYPTGTQEPLTYFLDEINEGKFTLSFAANTDKCQDTLQDYEQIKDSNDPATFRDYCFFSEKTKQIYQLDDIDFQLNSPLSNIKLTEAQGGCEPSQTWPRGFYKIQFKYSKQEGTDKWRWRIYAEPLRVTEYIQSSNDHDACKTDSTPQPRLCYYIYQSNAPRNQVAGGIGNCIASLRETIKENPQGSNYIPNSFINYSTSDPQNLGVYGYDEVFHHYYFLNDYPYHVNAGYENKAVNTRDLKLLNSNGLLCATLGANPRMTPNPTTITKRVAVVGFGDFVTGNWDDQSNIVTDKILTQANTATASGNLAEGSTIALTDARSGLANLIQIGGFGISQDGELDYISSMQITNGRKTCKNLFYVNDGRPSSLDEDDPTCAMHIYDKYFDASGQELSADPNVGTECIAHSINIH